VGFNIESKLDGTAILVEAPKNMPNCTSIRIDENREGLLVKEMTEEPGCDVAGALFPDAEIPLFPIVMHAITSTGMQSIDFIVKMKRSRVRRGQSRTLPMFS